MEYHITDDLEKLKAVLPGYLVDSLEQVGRKDDLIEVIMDLGRVPTARFTTGETVLDSRELNHEDLQYVVTKIGNFDADNRAGLERTLHRISGIRNRRGDIVGLTVRIGRSVYGTIDILRDIIESGQSVLILGAPGVGKTTMLREAARVLAENKRVVIVDTSNEIGGDGDVAHPAIGKARRMQVATPTLQHEVMIEAVENHNPEVIVIDEIGRELEAQAARTIAERGVQLIGTAHGQTLDNLLLNPTLSDLIGGIESVTLSDEEARRRGTQKAVLERRSPPTFDVLIELQTRHYLVVHEDVGAAVDARLRGRPMPVEVRYRNAEGEIVIETQQPIINGTERNGSRMMAGQAGSSGQIERGNGFRREREDRGGNDKREALGNGGNSNSSQPTPAPRAEPQEARVAHQTLHLYAYGVARNRLIQAAKRMRLPLIVEEEFENAQAIVTLKNYYRRRPKLIVDAERRGTPVHVLRANTLTQMEDFLADVFGLEATDHPDPFAEAIHETEAAIERIRSGVRLVDLTPAISPIRRVQHDMARDANLVAHSYGQEPRRYVRIFRDATNSHTQQDRA
ncbi:MAG: R3H domain-containing nucleic acid-binding protein [Chloroflexota bacterium]